MRCTVFSSLSLLHTHTHTYPVKESEQLLQDWTDGKLEEVCKLFDLDAATLVGVGNRGKAFKLLLDIVPFQSIRDRERR